MELITKDPPAFCFYEKRVFLRHEIKIERKVSKSRSTLEPAKQQVTGVDVKNTGDARGIKSSVELANIVRVMLE